MKNVENSPSMGIIKKLAKLRVSEIALEKIERLAAKAGIDENQLLNLYVDTKNNVYRKKFASIPFTDRILILPQCLRPKDCNAKLNELGYECEKCGNCEIKKIIELSEKIGYKKTYIVSGGSMVKKILTLERPKACLGIACVKELVLGSFLFEKFGIVPQGLVLLKDGCVETAVDMSSLLSSLQIKI
jgi:hypothetical protein